MPDQKSISTQQATQITTSENSPKPNPKVGIPLPTMPQPKKSFLRKPITYFLIGALLLLLGGYYYVYSTLSNEVSRLTQ